MVRNGAFGGPAPLQPQLHPADRRARRVLPRASGCRWQRPAPVRDRRRGTACSACAPGWPRLRLPEPAAALARGAGLVAVGRTPPTGAAAGPAHRRAAGVPERSSTTAPRSWRARLVAPLSDRQRARLSRGAGDRRPAGPRRHRRPGAGRPRRPGRPDGGGPLLRRAGPALRQRVRPWPWRRPRALPAAARTFVVARSDGDPVACGGVQPLGEGPPRSSGCGCTTSWRGAGFGARMLRRLEDDAAVRATPWFASTPTRH